MGEAIPGWAIFAGDDLNKLGHWQKINKAQSVCAKQIHVVDWSLFQAGRN
jgi:hypothetical protein